MSLPPYRLIMGAFKDNPYPARDTLTGASLFSGAGMPGGFTDYAGNAISRRQTMVFGGEAKTVDITDMRVESGGSFAPGAPLVADAQGRVVAAQGGKANMLALHDSAGAGQNTHVRIRAVDVVEMTTRVHFYPIWISGEERIPPGPGEEWARKWEVELNTDVLPPHRLFKFVGGVAQLCGVGDAPDGITGDLRHHHGRPLTGTLAVHIRNDLGVRAEPFIEVVSPRAHHRSPVLLIEAGGAFPYGANLETGADGRAVLHTSGTLVLRAFQGATASGQLVRVRVPRPIPPIYDWIDPYTP